MPPLGRHIGTTLPGSQSCQLQGGLCYTAKSGFLKNMSLRPRLRWVDFREWVFPKLSTPPRSRLLNSGQAHPAILPEGGPAAGLSRGVARHSPAIAASHLFENIQPFYWSATTSVYDPRYAWTLYTEDGNLGVGYKANPEFHVWCVRNKTG